MAQDEAPAATADDVQGNLDIVWTCIAAFLVFWMQAGFALVETGFTRAKNACNILFKNLMDFSIGSVAFFLVGFGIMWGWSADYADFTPWAGGDTSSWNWTFLIFQTVFCATAATIVSGAMAERTKFVSYLLYSAVISIVIYPVFGQWTWGEGWLSDMNFHDFAGSTIVHSVGGWLALAGAIVLGPRLGKYVNGKAKAIAGHNLPLAALGVFILWLGWFGFNPGSTTAGNGDIGFIAVTTNLAAAAGAITALITSWIIFKKPDLSMTLNGVLAGLVAITAPCDGVSPVSAVIIGAVAGVLVVLSVLFIDQKLKVDDPVGAVSVHGVNGVWGTLAYGLFSFQEGTLGLFNGGGFKQLGIQAVGALAGFGWAFIVGLVLFLILKYTIGLRASDEEQLKGLDITEHGNEAYSGFQIFTTE
ncbi:MAG: ammonium transporter [Acidobacteriota bacterium]|nr:ammonium transporter [Acidobacteriota bacterium]